MNDYASTLSITPNPIVGDTEAFEQHESSVRSYCRSYPQIFDRALNSRIYTESGEAYLDFLAGAGALNYGHNNPEIKKEVERYLGSDRVIHGLDMHTVAKREFISVFVDKVLKPRQLKYRMQFCGPTGTNGIEAAFKLARKATGRSEIFAFMGGFHGMTLGSLAATGNKANRQIGISLSGVTFMPYPTGGVQGFDTIDYIDTVLKDANSGIDVPAAIVVETIQAEGGINVAPAQWLRRLRALCNEHRIKLILDEIQVGCFRTGPFFSFERAGIEPDMIVLSKSLGGIGMPISVLLIDESLDIWKPGEHNGTFRGNQLAFVAATAAIRFALDNDIEGRVEQHGDVIAKSLTKLVEDTDPRLSVRGLGMIWGLDCVELGSDFSREVARICFENKLIVERVGRNDTVIKIMPPLTISSADLSSGLKIFASSLKQQYSKLQ